VRRRGPNDQFRLVEAPLATLTAVQWNGNDQRQRIDAAIGKLRDRLGQHVSQYGRCWPHLVVFQEMDETTQRPGILPKRDSAIELRLEIAATLATSVAYQQLRWQQALAALYALWRTNGPNGIQTLRAYRKTRNVYEGDTAEPAIGGEKNRENALYCRHNRRDEGRTLLGAPRSSVST